MFDASALRAPRDSPTVRGSRRRPDHAKRPGLRTKRCISGPRSLSWNDDVPRRIIAIRTTGRRGRPADCIERRRGDHGQRPLTFRPTHRSATSASSPTSTPARRPRPSGSCTTPARSTAWGTSTRATPRPTTCEEERERGITIVAAAITCHWKDADGQADHDQHHRHARPRRLHRRGRALAPRPGRRRRRVLGRRGGRGPERDGLAAGGQVSRPPDLLHQQDGPHRRRVRAGLSGDPGAAAGEPPDPRADPDRRRSRRDDGRVQGPDRPDHDEGALLQDRGPGLDHHRDRDPRGPSSRGRALAREDAQRPVRQRRGVHRGLHGPPRRGRAAARPDRRRAAAGDA